MIHALTRKLYTSIYVCNRQLFFSTLVGSLSIKTQKKAILTMKPTKSQFSRYFSSMFFFHPISFPFGFRVSTASPRSTPHSTPNSTPRSSPARRKPTFVEDTDFNRNYSQNPQIITENGDLP